MRVKRILNVTIFGLGLGFLVVATSCGKVQDAVTAVGNDVKIQGRWLLTETQNAGVAKTALDSKSVVLTFKDGKVVYVPTDGAKGEIFSKFNKCKQTIRPYKMDGSQLVLVAEGTCPEQRVTIQQLDSNVLKFPDPDDATAISVFNKIDENRYNALVKPADRTL